MARTKEHQYESSLIKKEEEGLASLGIMSNETWLEDPKRLTFVLSRYKFVSKMLQGKENVLEIGCADAFGTRIVQQAVQKLTAIDFDPIFVQDVKDRMNKNWEHECLVHDMLAGPVSGNFDAAFALDVLEHIKPEDEDLFVKNIVSSLNPDGVVIFGCPSLESQQYASPRSKAGHVNCKSGEDFKNFGLKHFKNVFMFSMNDEVLHTGFFPMSQYLFMLGVSQK